MHRGDTLYFDADIIVSTITIHPSATLNPHLWIVITEPGPPEHQCVIVNVTTLKERSDTTVILHVGDHPFIDKDSVLRYADARFADARHLDDVLKKRLAKHRDPVSPDLLKRIQDGAVTSIFTPKKIVEYCKACLNSDTEDMPKQQESGL